MLVQNYYVNTNANKLIAKYLYACIYTHFLLRGGGGLKF